MSPVDPTRPIRLSIVTPVFNEEEVIERFYRRTRAVLDGMAARADAEILFVVDRSTDRTLEILRGLAASDPKAKVLALSSRFGHQMSLMAGIERAVASDAVIMMDSDLQHPPELIPRLVDEFTAGAEIVYTVRRDTEEVSRFRKWLGNAFYRFLGSIAQVPISANAADFRLISGRVARLLSESFQERGLFLRGLFSWIGLRQAAVEYTAARRAGGSSKYSFSRMFQLATAGILAFSTKPLQFGIFVGLSFAALAFLLILIAIVRFFLIQEIPSGFTTIVVVLLLFSGVQLIILGIVGTYVGGIYEEVKRRPRYIVEEEIGGRREQG